MTKTNLQLINFINFARTYGKLGKDGKPVADPPKTKFTYALERMDKRLKTQIESYDEALTDLEIEHAATEGEKGPMLTDDKGKFRYTKDGLRARNKARKELLEKNAADFEPYYATEVPDSLTQAEKEVCAGFVITEEAAAVEPVELAEAAANAEV